MYQVAELAPSQGFTTSETLTTAYEKVSWNVPKSRKLQAQFISTKNLL